MAELDGKSGKITIEGKTLGFVSDDYNDERDISDVAPDVNTAGKATVDPDIYQITLSLTGNMNVATYYNGAVYELETAFNAGGTSNAVAVIRWPDGTDDTYKDTGTFRVHSFTRGLKVGEIQQWSAELKSTGDVTRTRPSS